MCVCARNPDDLLVVANYTCQRCFPLQLEEEVKVTPPGRHVTPTETVFGFTGNFFCRAVSHHLTGLSTPPCRDVGLSWCSVDDIGSIQVILHRAHRKQNTEVEQKTHIFTLAPNLLEEFKCWKLNLDDGGSEFDINILHTEGQLLKVG